MTTNQTEYTHKRSRHNHKLQPRHRPCSACAQLSVLAHLISLLTDQWQLHKTLAQNCSHRHWAAPYGLPSTLERIELCCQAGRAAAHQTPMQWGQGHTARPWGLSNRLTLLTAAGATQVRGSSTDPPTCQILATATRYVCGLLGCGVCHCRTAAAVVPGCR
jgi:hypothetical protein